MEVVIAGLAIIGQLETIYMVINNIYQFQQKVCRLKDTCRDFAGFVKEIETVLRRKASHLTKEEMFSVDAKRQLDKLEENLRFAAILLSNLESPLKIAAYTGVAANKIQELRGQLLESVTLLTFHIVCSPRPSDKQPSDLRDPPDRPLRRNLSHLRNPSVPSNTASRHPRSPTHHHSSVTSQSMAENSTHHRHPDYPQQSRPMSKLACHSSAETVTYHTSYDTHQAKADSPHTFHSFSGRPTFHHGDMHRPGTSHSPAETPTRTGITARISDHTQHQEIHHHGNPTNSNHDRYHTHQFGGSSNQPPPTRAQSMPSHDHSPSHSQHSPVAAHDPLIAENYFRLLCPYHNPSPEYRHHPEGASQLPRRETM